MHVDLIVPYRKSIRQQYPGDTIISNNVSLTCMTTIDPATGWFEIVQIPTFDLNEVTGGNDAYIDKSYYRVSQLFKNKWICRYPRPRKVMFDKGPEFKRDFTTFLKDFDIKPVLTSTKKPQATAPVERLHQVILNLLATNDIYKNISNHIYPLGENLAYIS